MRINRTLYTLVFLTLAQLLSACSEHTTRPSHGISTVVSVSHSVYIEGGVLKVLSDNEQNILFVYVRPESIDQWVATGGGGGMQDEPWLFKSAASWTLGDENGGYSKGAPQKTFDFLFDARNMTITVDSGAYAVNRGGFIVIALDSDWRTSTVESGMESLRRFNMPDDEKQRLLTEARKHYAGL